jgi:hypothetical protein
MPEKSVATLAAAQQAHAEKQDELIGFQNVGSSPC